MLQRKISVAASVNAASRVFASLAAAVLLAACGQKGALALGRPVTASAAVASPASAAAPAR